MRRSTLNLCSYGCLPSLGYIQAFAMSMAHRNSAMAHILTMIIPVLHHEGLALTTSPFLHSPLGQLKDIHFCKPRPWFFVVKPRLNPWSLLLEILAPRLAASRSSTSKSCSAGVGHGSHPVGNLCWLLPACRPYLHGLHLGSSTWSQTSDCWNSTKPTWKNSYYRSSIMLKAFFFGEETSQDRLEEVEWLSTASLPWTGFPGKCLSRDMRKHPWPHHHRGWNNPGPAASLPRVDVVCHLSEDHKTHKLGHLAISKLHGNWYVFFFKRKAISHPKTKRDHFFPKCTSEALTSAPKQTPTFPKKESNLMWPSWKGSQNDTHAPTEKLVN